MNKKVKLILLFMLVLAGFLLFGNTQVAKSQSPAGPTASTIDNVMRLTYPLGSSWFDTLCAIDQTTGECTYGTAADLWICDGQPANENACLFKVVNYSQSCYWYNDFGGGSGFGTVIVWPF